MLPDAPVDARRKKAGLILGALTSCGIGVISLLTGPPARLPVFLILAFVVLANAGIVVYSWPATDGFPVRVRGSSRNGGRRNGGAGGLGLGAGAEPAPTAAEPRPVLRAVARLMPADAGRRWLAEAESLLFEMPAGQRRQAVRSYLRSAPRLAAMMWARRLRGRTGRRA
jgi:hypothetical protein